MHNSTDEPREILLTPNFKAMFRTMLTDAERQFKAERLFEFPGLGTRKEALEDLQRWFAPLALAVNCATSKAEIEEVRQLMADILAKIDGERQKSR